MSPYRMPSTLSGEPDPSDDGVERGHIERDVVDCPYCQAKAETRALWSGSSASLDPELARPLALAAVSLVASVQILLWLGT